MNDEHEAEVTRLAQELEEERGRQADRKAAEIMEKLDIQALNAGINKTVNPTSLKAAVNMTYKTKDRYTLGVAKPDYNITLNNTMDGKQVQIGKLDFNGAVLKFEGNAEESAVVFMDSLAATFQGRLKAEHLSAAKLLVEFVTFELGDEMELDDAYRKGFNDAMYAVRGVLSKKIKEMEHKP
jgi:NAD(P)-dependent dehydrogenase (short-subunit alcohol dehydrogenase family)